MQETLKQIEDAYVALVPAALQRMQRRKTAGAFIPYFAWEAEPSDHAELGQQIYPLGESYFSKLAMTWKNDLTLIPGRRFAKRMPNRSATRTCASYCCNGTLTKIRTIRL